jgi:hypothetical protein
MPVEHPLIPSGFAGRWLLACAIGWLVGIPSSLLIVAGAEAVGLPEQFGIGLGIGLSVGFFQWRVARRSFGASIRWFWSSAIGLACPFLLFDLLGYGASRLALVIAAAGGGLIAGWGQSSTLRVCSIKRYWWMPASALGWALAAAATVLTLFPGHPSSGLQWLRQLLAIGSGGVMLAVATGPVIAWLCRPYERSE